jgi:hypothetical protein
MATKRTKTEEVIVEVGTEAPKSLARVITEGAADACTAASTVTQAAGKAARKTVYSGFYYVSYGVVFSALLVGNLLPSNNAMGEGVHDGALAARKDFDARQQGQHQPGAEAAATA